jgi:hypothetical protein
MTNCRESSLLRRSSSSKKNQALGTEIGLVEPEIELQLDHGRQVPECE